MSTRAPGADRRATSIRQRPPGRGDRRGRRSVEALVAGLLVTLLACAGSTGSPTEPALPTSRPELARELIEAGIVRVQVEGIVDGFRRLALDRALANVEALEARLESVDPAGREVLRQRLEAMPGRFEADLQRFLDSIDFEDLTQEIYGPLYADRFDVEELQAILRFYRSPAGQAFARENAQISRTATSELAARMEPTLAGFMRQWFEEQLQDLRSGARREPNAGGASDEGGRSPE